MSRDLYLQTHCFDDRFLCLLIFLLRQKALHYLDLKGLNINCVDARHQLEQGSHESLHPI